MSPKVVCAALFVLLLGCDRLQNRQQESSRQAGRTSAVQPQPFNAAPGSESVSPSAVPPPSGAPASPVPQSSTRRAKRLPATGASSQKSAPAALQASPASTDAGDRRPSPYGERRLYTQPAEPRLVIPAGTVVRVRLAETVDTKHVHAGDKFSATLDAPILVRDRVVVPKGTRFEGHITVAKASGRLRGRGVLGLALDSFRLRGQTYAIQTSADVHTSSAHKKRNLAFIGGGSGFGAAVGAIASGGLGAVIGAGAGAAAGTTTAFITGKRNVKLPVETPLLFSLRSNVDVRS